MKISLPNSLKTRPNDYSKDSRSVNGYADGAGDKRMVRKRPGTNPSTFNFTTPQAFSSLADLMVQLEYGTFPVISNMLFTLNGDSWGFTDISTAVWGGGGGGGGTPGNGAWTDEGTLPISPDRYTSFSHGGYFYGVEYISVGKFKRSVDLVNWTDLTLPPSAGFRFYSLGSSIIALSTGNEAGVNCISSDGGSSWSQQHPVGLNPRNQNDGGQFGAVLGSTFYFLTKYSGVWYCLSTTNGYTYSTIATSIPSTAVNRYQLVATDTYLYAIPFKIGSMATDIMYKSTDGITWTACPSPIGITPNTREGVFSCHNNILYYLVNGALWYADNSEVWTLGSYTAMPDPLEAPGVVSYGGKLTIIGGYDIWIDYYNYKAWTLE